MGSLKKKQIGESNLWRILGNKYNVPAKPQGNNDNNKYIWTPATGHELMGPTHGRYMGTAVPLAFKLDKERAEA